MMIVLRCLARVKGNNIIIIFLQFARLSDE